MRSEISVIIPVQNDAGPLRKTVAAILAQSNGLVREIILAVGPSHDDTRVVAQELAAAEPIVRVIDNPTGKTPVALNAAITASTAPIIARIDARAVIPIGYLTLAVDTLTESGAANVGAVQNPVGFLPASARLPRQWPRSWALVGLVTGGAM
ncbi:glycosyltransferase [bacterium]|nr:glycosyltransferase [Acidimicrobiaceae bacterium]MCH9803808.1 glycosyltransferase [bacterium]MDA9359636.1 glycosyltransferase [bacterium]MDB9845579.1 glycosyltransferase [Acidimicrobiales bacterium]